jgi:DNA-binding NtrC family response regulator
MADGGSLFLDELGETSLSVQVNLLRVLEDFTFRRVGGTEPVEVDVRIIAATNVDLEMAVKGARFREDLFYRLNVFPITLPPLRERREDVPLLLHHFLKDAADEYKLPVPAVQPEARDRICAYGWPGNVRQLRAMCERWVILCNGGELGGHMLPREMVGPGVAAEPQGGLYIDENIPLKDVVGRMQDQVERAYLHKLLIRHQGHLIQTAEGAGITRRTLYTRMKELGLDVADYKPAGAR